MIASEFAFLALGLVLGIASGAALVMVLGSRPPMREVRLTVSHDVVPRRSATLSSDAFLTSAAEPARGGPADRRLMDRPPSPVMASSPSWGLAAMTPQILAQAWPGSRTPVLSAAGASGPMAIGIFPKRDPALDALRIEAAAAAARLYRADLPVQTALLETRQTETTSASGAVPPFMPLSPDMPADQDPQLAEPGDDAVGLPDPIDEIPSLTRILRGDQRALFATVGALAGENPDERRAWEVALLGVTQAIVARAIDRGCLDFPVGNAFWDTFTTEQCREIAGALASAGHRFDGLDGWADERIPTHRDLTTAVAAIGMEPRRIRGWPTHDEIVNLYADVTAAADEYQLAVAPNLDREEVRALIGEGGADRSRVWSNWDLVRKLLLEPVSAG